MAPVRSRAQPRSTPSQDGQKTSAGGARARGASAPSQRAAASRTALNAEIVARRVAAGRAAEEQRDPTGEWHQRLRELADDHDVNAGDVLDEWDERAAVRQYDAGCDRATAERLAFVDVKERLEPQRSLL